MMYTLNRGARVKRDISHPIISTNLFYIYKLREKNTIRKQRERGARVCVFVSATMVSTFSRIPLPFLGSTRYFTFARSHTYNFFEMVFYSLFFFSSSYFMSTSYGVSRNRRGACGGAGGRRGGKARVKFSITFSLRLGFATIFLFFFHCFLFLFLWFFVFVGSTTQTDVCLRVMRNLRESPVPSKMELRNVMCEQALGRHCVYVWALCSVYT